MEQQNKNTECSRVYNFNAQVGQFIEHVDTVNFSLDGDGKFHFSNVGQVNGMPKDFPAETKAPQERKATKEMMSCAMVNTLVNGNWKSGRSWAVVYAVYQVWGYQGRINDFLEEVVTWPDVKRNRYVCNRDAVSKLTNKYVFSKDIKKWRGDGVPEQYCILGEKLNEELEKMLAQKGAQEAQKA